MFSVIRFYFPSADSTKHMVGRLNAVEPRLCASEDRIGGRASVVISEEPHFDIHLKKLSAYVLDIYRALKFSRENDVSVEIDIMIEPDDFDGRPYISLPLDASIMALMGSMGIRLTITASNRMNE